MAEAVPLDTLIEEEEEEILQEWETATIPERLKRFRTTSKTTHTKSGKAMIVTPSEHYESSSFVITTTWRDVMIVTWLSIPRSYNKMTSISRSNGSKLLLTTIKLF